MSGPKTLWSQEELNEIERVRVMYEKMLDWVQKEMYNGIPFRSGKKSEDPTSSMWVEPITIFDKRGGEEDETSRLTQVSILSNGCGPLSI